MFKVIRTIEYVSRLKNCLEFSEPSLCLDEAMPVDTEKVLCCLNTARSFACDVVRCKGTKNESRGNLTKTAAINPNALIRRRIQYRRMDSLTFRIPV